MRRKIRVVLFEDNTGARDRLKKILQARGYEILDYDDPSSCPMQLSHDCQCDEMHICADIVISDVDMPNVSGIEFMERQVRKGCKVRNIGMMSASWSSDNINRAEAIGCTVFEKPVRAAVFEHWLDQCESRININKELNDWFK